MSTPHDFGGPDEQSAAYWRKLEKGTYGGRPPRNPGGACLAVLLGVLVIVVVFMFAVGPSSVG